MQHVARTEQLLFRVYGLMFYSEVSETKLESAQSVKVSPLQQAHMQGNKIEYRSIYVLLVSQVSSPRNSNTADFKTKPTNF